MTSPWLRVLDLCGQLECDLNTLQEAVATAWLTHPNDKIREILEQLDWDMDNSIFLFGLEEKKQQEFREKLSTVVQSRPKAVDIKFCQECNNMLYPAENKEEKKLKYVCKQCEYEEETDDYCVHINTLAQEHDGLDFVNSDVASDPSLSHTRGNFKPCPECGHQDAVYFQTQINRDQSAMRLYYVCCNPSCGHKWTDMDKTDEL
eukprot:m.340760 g.340760  ORF g.340760 m.340760 type:complete len:204 (-) comp19508_c0_seq1:425-1036(-)